MSPAVSELIQLSQFIEIGGSFGPSCLFPVLELVADVGYVCGSRRNPAIAALQLSLQSRGRKPLVFMPEKSRTCPGLGGGMVFVSAVIPLSTEGDQCLCRQPWL